MATIRINAFIWGLALVALALLVFTLPRAAKPDPTGIAVAGALAALIAAAYVLPVHFDFKSNVVLDTSLIFTAVLIFEPGIALLVVGAGTLAGQLMRRTGELEETVFNTSQVMVQAAFGCLTLQFSGWQMVDGFDTLLGGLSLALAAVAIYLTNTILVAAIIALHTGLNLLAVWLQSVTRNDSLEQLGQFSVGLLAAMLIDVHAWALPFLVLLIAIIYVSLRRQYALRAMTIEAIEGLADLVDFRDRYTANHSRRVAVFAREIAIVLGLEPVEVLKIERAARVHDLGKVMIDLALLSKPGKLSDDEWRIFKSHPASGWDILRGFPDFRGESQYVRHHHERIDGTGYPDGLVGGAIPLGARIIAVADGFDAMASPRPYRPALAPDVVIAELERGRGSQWDAAAVDALLTLIESGRVIIDSDTEFPHILDALRKPERLAQTA